ncbi:UDP-glycosyltransferase 76C3 [Morella rubra]|uniref:UDP-glycosyltransferase 76C3 n=1 Tax=Morella rubra TaxID=262757 RepID=A0A6A1WK04_9ROSI|nr:UDP-glycosyltransferase 76C3 [Morella rubra]
MEKQEAKRVGRRLVLVVYPFQGHINPMLQLATILNSKGFSITVVHPEFNSLNVSKHSHFTFVPIPDGLSKTNVSTENAVPTISALKKNCEDPLQRYLEQMLEAEDSHDRVACVVYDGLMHFAQVVADRLKLPALRLNPNMITDHKNLPLQFSSSLKHDILANFLHFWSPVNNPIPVCVTDFLRGDQVPELQSLMLKVKDQHDTKPNRLIGAESCGGCNKKCFSNNSEHNALP